MRRSVFAVVLTAVAALLASLTVSPGAAAPVAIAPGSTPDTGSFSVDPATFTEGQSVKLAANFPDGVFTVTFFKKTGYRLDLDRHRREQQLRQRLPHQL